MRGILMGLAFWSFQGTGWSQTESESPDGDASEHMDEETREAYIAYKMASKRYDHEMKMYHLDLRRHLMSDYQEKLSSVDRSYSEKIAKLRDEEQAMRDDVINRMEAFLSRYGDKEEKSADILYRLARLYYERADEAYLAGDGNQEHPDFSKSLQYISTLEKNFPKFDQMDGALYLKGYCQSQMGEGTAARDTFMQIVAMYPDSPRRAEVLTRIGEYYFSKSQDAILGLGGEIMWQDALYYYAQAVEAGPESSVYDRALYRKAWTEYYIEDYDAMIRDFVALVGYADKVENGSALRSEAIEFMAAALAEEDWDLNDDVSVDPEFGMKRFDKYLHTGAPFELEVLRKFADTLMEQLRYEKAAEAYGAYISRATCADDLPEVIRVYVAALNLSGKMDQAVEEQSKIEQRIGVQSKWYTCQAKKGNQTALASANMAMQQALKNSIMGFHDRVARADDDVRQAEAYLEDPKLSAEERFLGEQRLKAAQAAVVETNWALADITATMVRQYPDDEENYNYRYLLGQAYFYSGQYEKSIEAFMAIRDIENSHYQADAARYVADAYEYLITERAGQDDRYIYALSLQDLLERVNDGRMSLKRAPTSILLSSAITSATPEAVKAELETRRGGSVRMEMPKEVQKLIDAREVFGEIELKSGKTDEDPDALGPRYRYDNAMIYYNYGNFEEAEARFNLIIENSPASQEALSAADMIVAEYELRGDLDKVAQLSDMYAGMQLGSANSDSVINSRFKDKKYNALFKKAFKLFDNKQYLEAAEEFKRIIDENPTFEHNHRALYNAAYAYEQMKHYDSAMQLYRRVLEAYGETEEAVNALYRIGVNAEMFFDFDTAVDSFLSLYRNPKPLYRQFKYRVNALRNAARIKLLIEDKKGAAQLLELYHNDYPGQPDAPRFLYEAGRQYAEIGMEGDAQRIFKVFRQKYASDPSMRPYIIASYVTEADDMRAHHKKKSRAYETLYETAVTLYQNAPGSAGGVGRDYAAKAAYTLAEVEYETWNGAAIKGKMKSMVSQLKNHMAEMKRIYNAFAQVMTYNSPIWGIASRYAIARMMHELVNALEDMPCPSDVRRGSDAHLSFLASMSDMATGTRDEAIKMYQNAIEASKLAGISMVWTEKSLDGLKQLDRTASTQERLAPASNLYSPEAMVTPSVFKAQQQAKAAAEAKAKAELEAILKGEE